jgi:nucleoside-triphosphatase THEP1
VGGILTPAQYAADGSKAGFAAHDVFTGEERSLAQVTDAPTAAPLPPAADDAPTFRVGKYLFERAAMRWAVQRVTIALSAPLDAVLLDEIGPLELARGGGFAPALDALSAAHAATVILVVRSELLSALQERLIALGPRVIALTLANRDQVPDHLLDAVWSGATRASG